MANAPYAEGFDLRQLTWVEDEALGFNAFVERFEQVARIFWRMKGDDNRRLDRFWHKAADAQFGHAVDQRLTVIGITLVTRR